MGLAEGDAPVLGGRQGVASLHSVLILGADAVAAALPATPVQLAHACHRWGFFSVIPASWGDELLASEVIRRCASRENRPVIQCSCPRVADRLGAHASKLDDTILWLTTPPVAAARYVRALAGSEAVHITYAGSCPGAIDASIDQRVTPTELLLEITARGIDLTAQPMVFEDIIPPDRRRHYSAPGGSPDAQRLWEASAFRLAHPADADLAVGVAQLLLTDERVLVDLAASVGCTCRAGTDDEPLVVLRSPTPVVHDRVVEVARSAPAMREAAPHRQETVETRSSGGADRQEAARQPSFPRRQSPVKTIIRRSGAWRRQTPRPGSVVARTSASFIAMPGRAPLLQRREVRLAIATLIAVAALLVGVMIGKNMATPPAPTSGAVVTGTPGLLSRSR